MRWIKGRPPARCLKSSRMQKTVLGSLFLGAGYFCVTAGELTQEMIRLYLEHHLDPPTDDGFEVQA